MTAKICLLLAFIVIFQTSSSTGVTQFSSQDLFAADLFKEISKTRTNENIVFSPISIQMAMAMTYLGAEGETAKELKQGLRLSSSDKINISEGFAQVLKDNKGEAQLDIANRIFFDSRNKLVSTFNELAEKHFQSKAVPVNFSDSPKAIKIVNDWIEQKTNKKISNVLQPGSVDSNTAALIVNAIYFKGKWQSPFSKHSTRERPFWVSKTKSIDVDTMIDDGVFKYGNFIDLDATAVELPYRDSDISMLLILPKERDGLAKLEEKLSSVSVTELAEKMQEEDIDIFLPKFKIDFSVPLVDVLNRLGIQSIFGERANLTGLFESGPRVFVSDVQHKAFIDVNEAGSEAAAATIVKIKYMSLNLNSKRFIADHPFVFAIKSPENVYFMGHVATF